MRIPNSTASTARALIAPGVVAVCLGVHLSLLVACSGSGERAEATLRASEPAATQAKPVDSSHIATSPQLLVIEPGVINGPAPFGDADFDTLAAMGIRTVLSVDGARTDIARATARGMTYAHVPIGYDGIDSDQAAQIARVFRDLPRPIYIHCHHGKHRGPAAAAVGLIATSDMTPGAGRAFLEAAGTSPSYPGLYLCVADAAPMSSAVLDAAPVAPPQAQIDGFIAAMAHVDRVWDRIKLIRAAGWATPADHPDLVPAAEAGMLHDGLRASHETAPDWDPIASVPEFVAPMLRSLGSSKALEDSLVAGDRTEAEAAYTVLAASCRECHVVYRNQPGR